MINNFDIIRQMFTFDTEDEFYFCQIIRRRKENPNDRTNSQLINAYYFNSFEKFDRLKEQIIAETTIHNARAYINPNRRSYKKCALHMLEILSRRIIQEEYKFAMKAFDAAALKYTIEPKNSKKWVIDIDTHDQEFIDNVTKVIESVNPKGTKKVLQTIPTKNGVHLLTAPFHVEEYQYEIKNLSEQPEIKRNDHTLLFMP